MRTSLLKLFFAILGIALPTGAANASEKTPSLTNIFYLGDSYLDDGNYKSLNNGTGPAWFSNGAPWCTIANLRLGLPSAGRWTATGGQSHQFGNIYAVSGAGINSSLTQVNTSLSGQVAKLLADYPNGLPANTLVVIGIGTNDIRGVAAFGGIWTNSPMEWHLQNSGFVVPAAGATVTVAVTSTTGMTPGDTNLIAFPTTSLPAMLALTAVNAKENTVTLTNKYGIAGTQIPPNAGFEVCGKWFLDQVLQALAGDMKSILGRHGHLVLAALQPTEMLPTYNRQPNEALVHKTWEYFYDKMLELAPKISEQVLVFDLKPIFQDIISDPTKYGFKVNYPCWMGTGAANPDDYVFYDAFHPSGAMHKYIAKRFLEFLRTKGLTDTE
jgi:hypothetical protein